VTLLLIALEYAWRGSQRISSKLIIERQEQRIIKMEGVSFLALSYQNYFQIILRLLQQEDPLGIWVKIQKF
jgi:hypothetical protein